MEKSIKPRKYVKEAIIAAEKHLLTWQKELHIATLKLVDGLQVECFFLFLDNVYNY